MFSLALALGTGILLAHFFWRPPIWIGIAAVVFTISAAVLAAPRPRLAWSIAHLSLIALGGLACAGQAESASAALPLAEVAPFTDGQPVALTGRVVREPGAFVQAKDHIQFDLESEELATQAGHKQVEAGVRLSLYRRYTDAEYDADDDSRAAFPALR